MSDEVQRRITIGQGINLAATIAAAVATPDSEPARVLADVASIAPDCIDICFQLHGEAAVKHAFPGTQASAFAAAAAPEVQSTPTVVDHPAYQGPQAQPYQAPPATTTQPAPIPGATQGGGSKSDAKWQAYFASPGDYYDNRFSKRSPNAPDFKHKQTGEGLWLNGKFPAPAWVLQRLGGQ